MAGKPHPREGREARVEGVCELGGRRREQHERRCEHRDDEPEAIDGGDARPVCGDEEGSCLPDRLPRPGEEEVERRQYQQHHGDGADGLDHLGYGYACEGEQAKDAGIAKGELDRARDKEHAYHEDERAGHLDTGVKPVD